MQFVNIQSITENNAKYIHFIFNYLQKFDLLFEKHELLKVKKLKWRKKCLLFPPDREQTKGKSKEKKREPRQHVLCPNQVDYAEIIVIFSAARSEAKSSRNSKNN